MIAIGFALHAHRTGRPQFWIYILIFIPLAGSIAYVLFELLPEVANSRRARRVATDIRSVVSPDADWHALRRDAQERDTVEAKSKLARECERKGMWVEAIAVYRQAARGPYVDDPGLLSDLARALLGSGNAEAALTTLDRLRAGNPDYQNQDAHLTYARALETIGREQEARQEYRAIAQYYVGTQARTRYALLLLKLGEPAAAKRLFEEVVRVSKARSVVLTDADREWVRVAQRNLDRNV